MQFKSNEVKIKSNGNQWNHEGNPKEIKVIIKGNPNK